MSEPGHDVITHAAVGFSGCSTNVLKNCCSIHAELARSFDGIPRIPCFGWFYESGVSPGLGRDFSLESLMRVHWPAKMCEKWNSHWFKWCVVRAVQRALQQRRDRASFRIILAKLGQPPCADASPSHSRHKET